MSATGRHTRSQTWLESLGDWAWPGSPAPAEVLPPPWIPAVPPPVRYALGGQAAGAQIEGQRGARARRVLISGLLSALLATGAAVALRAPLNLERLLGKGGYAPSRVAAPAETQAQPAVPLPQLTPLAADRTGGSLYHASYASEALAGRGAFIVYLPPGYQQSAPARYPVIYLLHGRNGHAGAFLEIGIQHTLDHLIVTGAIPPMIAVMPQDKSGLQNWRNNGWRNSASYVVEVQELIDRMLRTVPARAARVIAGSSMGGFGAMHVALANPERFAVVESWLGFFDGLQGELKADSAAIRRLGLHAFLYGAEADPVALPEEDPNFAEELRSEGADAEGVIYPGGHSLQKVKEHLEAGLLFAARSLSDAERRETSEEARARWRG
jgi:enterochelin esterase-like enzyme